MPTNSNLWASDDDQDFLKPKKGQNSKDPKKSSLFDSDDDKELELDLIRMKEAFKTRIHAAADKSSTSAKDTKKPSLFDYDDDTPVKVTKVPAPVKKSSSGLFDEFDDDDDDLLLNKSKSKPSSAKDSKSDFEALYKAEKDKRMELEQIVVKLRLEIVELRKAAGLPDPDEPAETAAPVSQSAQPSEEWERLAQEEKERRQRARAMKSKSRPVSKRLSSAVAGSSSGSSGATTAVPSTSVSSAPEKSGVEAVGGEGLSSGPSSVHKLTPLPTWDESDSESEVPPKSNGTVAPATKVDNENATSEPPSGTGDTAVPQTEEKSSHWEALAEQEKERKAQARRSRAVVRGGAKPKSLAAAVHTSAASSTTTSRSVSPLPGKPSVPAASAAPAPVNNSDLKRFDSSGEDSGWDSNAESEAEAPSSSAAPVATVPQPVEAKPSDNGGSGKGQSVGGGVSEEVESELDNRLIDWVRGCRNNIKRLLQTVHKVYRGPLPDLESLWNEDNGDDDSAVIRKAYLKVVRVCHPDKQTHLDPQSLEFLEASRVFTIISDSYNKYKAANG